MEGKKALIVGTGFIAILGLGYYFLIHKKQASAPAGSELIDGTMPDGTVNKSLFEGKVVRSPGEEAWFLVKNGKKIVLLSVASLVKYGEVNNGEPEIIDVELETLKSIPNDPIRYVSEEGTIKLW